jgi:heparan-sulfate lyase
MRKKSIAFLMLLCGLYVFADTPCDTLVKRLNIVWHQIDFKKVDFPKSLKGFDERADALIKYFKERKPMTIERPWTLEHDHNYHQTLANDALKHYFIGQPTYPTMFRGEKINWIDSPVADNQWIIQMNRHIWMPSLAYIYDETKDERYAKEWCTEINSWVDTGHSSDQLKKFPMWSGGLEPASRMSFWPYAFESFRKSPSMDRETMINFLWSTLVHIGILEKYGEAAIKMKAPSNYALHQQNGLTNAVRYFPELKDYSDALKRSINRYIILQKKMVNDEGVILDFSPHYHLVYPSSFLKAYSDCKGTEAEKLFSKEYLDLIEKGIDAVMIWSHPTGEQPMFGDAWDDSKGFAQNYIKSFLKDFNRADWKYYVTYGKEGIVPKKRLFALEESGIYSMRSDWSTDAVFAVIRNQNINPDLIWHSQIDNMTFELSAYGERLMIDSGCYNYDGEPDWRAWFRTPQAHQVVTIDNQPIDGKGRLAFQKSFQNIDVTSLENQVNRDLCHRRTFFLVDKKYFVILDELSGNASGKLRQHFQFTEVPYALENDRLVAKTMKDKGANLYVASSENNNISLVEEEGWISRKYNEKEKRPAFAFTQDKKANETKCFLTLIAPTPHDKRINSAEITFLKDGKPTIERTNSIGLRINHETYYQIDFDLDRHEVGLKSVLKKEDWLSQDKKILKDGI